MGLPQTNDAPVDIWVDYLLSGYDLDIASPPARSSVDVAVDSDPDATILGEWDRLVARTPRSDVAQLSTWAQVRRQASYAPTFLLARIDGELAGGALVLSRRLGLGVVAYVPFGPVVPTGAHRREVTDALCHALADLARRRFAALFVQPMTGDDDVPDRFLRLGFRPSAAGITPTATIAVDLSRPTEELQAGLRSGTRGSIKRATRQGVRVRNGDERDLPTVAALLADTADHHDFTAPSPGYLDAMYRSLAPGGHLHIFLAERDGVALAADVLTSSGNVLTLRLTGMRRDGDARRVGAAAQLRWETMLWARANGYDSIDLGGIPVAAVDAIRAGHTDLAARVDGRTYYKASFGGTATCHPTAVELIPSATTRLAYDLVRRSTGGHRLLTATKRLLRGSASSR